MVEGGIDLALALDRIGERPVEYRVEASKDECAAIAERFSIDRVEGLHAQGEVSADGSAYRLTGRIRAKAVQPCVVSGDPVTQIIDEDFSLRLVAPSELDTDEEERELSEEDVDTLAHDGAKIALGELVVETLGLALDPYPRSPAAEEAARKAGLIGEEEAGPFGALAGLKQQLEDKKDR